MSEWMRNKLTVAHEVEQLNIVVAVIDPNLIVADAVQSLNPTYQADPHMLICILHKRTAQYLLTH